MKTLPRHSELAKALVYWRYELNDEAACQSQGAFGTKSTERPPALELSCTVPVLASHTRNNLTANCAREQPLQPLHWICSPGIFRRCLLPFSISAVYPSTSEPHNLRHTSHKTTFSSSPYNPEPSCPADANDGPLSLPCQAWCIAGGFSQRQSSGHAQITAVVRHCPA